MRGGYSDDEKIRRKEKKELQRHTAEVKVQNVRRIFFGRFMQPQWLAWEWQHGAMRRRRRRSCWVRVLGMEKNLWNEMGKQQRCGLW